MLWMHQMSNWKRKGGMLAPDRRFASIESHGYSLRSLLSTASKAASVPASVPAVAYMRADVDSAGIEPLLAGGALERT